MKEADVYPWIVSGMLHEGHAVARIADGSAGKKPFDIVGITDAGVGIGIEVKILKSASGQEAESIRWQLFEQHQKNWLRAYASRGAIALAAVYKQDTGKLYIWRLEDKEDICNRPADYIMQRSNYRGAQIIYGWTDIVRKENNNGQ